MLNNLCIGTRPTLSKIRRKIPSIGIIVEVSKNISQLM